MDAGDSEFFRQVVLLATANFKFSYLAFNFAEKTSRLHGVYLLCVFVHCFPVLRRYMIAMYNIVHVGSEMKCVLLVWSAWAILKTFSYFSILSRIFKISTSGLHIVSTAVIWALNGIKGQACLQECEKVKPKVRKNPFGVWRSLIHFVAHGYIVESPLTSTQCKM